MTQSLQVEKSALFDNLDGAMLILDEIVDRGQVDPIVFVCLFVCPAIVLLSFVTCRIILELNSNVIAQRVAMKVNLLI